MKNIGNPKRNYGYRVKGDASSSDRSTWTKVSVRKLPHENVSVTVDGQKTIYAPLKPEGENKSE